MGGKAALAFLVATFTLIAGAGLTAPLGGSTAPALRHGPLPADGVPADLAPLQVPSVLAPLAAPPAQWQEFARVGEAHVLGAPQHLVDLPAHGLPSQELAVLLAESGKAGAVPAASLAAYDALPAAQRDALALLLAAYRADARLVAGAFGPGAADYILHPPAYGIDDVPVDWAALLQGQRLLLAATQAALPALQAFDGSTHAPMAPVDVCDAVLLDLGVGDSVRTCDYRFALDLGGADVWSQNGGGNGAAITTTGSVAIGSAGYALDLAGDDVYDARYVRGAAAGGGTGGAGFLVDVAGNDRYDVVIQRAGASNGGADVGAGALLDLAGDDLYYGASGTDPAFHDQGGGHNGGAVSGVGLHVDFGGNDVRDGFIGGSGGVNGGAHGGSGLTIDYAGDDRYDGFVKNLAGVNGGTFSGAGALLDAAGNDVYRGTSLTFGGVNGGSFVGFGTLVDLAGNDDYDGTQGNPGTDGSAGGVNGGAFEIQGYGTLYDFGGDDTFNGMLYGSGGINGGSFFGFGMMTNKGGVDTYDVHIAAGPTRGVNGGTFFGSGFLWDAGGVGDRYRRDPAAEFAFDQTLQHVGAEGNQLDSGEPHDFVPLLP